MAGNITQAERAKRLRRVREAIVSPRGLSRLSGVAEDLAEEFGCSVRMVWMYRRQVLAPPDPADMMSEAEVRAEFVERVRAATTAAQQDGAHGPAMTGLKIEGSVLGVEAPAKSEVKHTGGISIEGLSDEQAARLRAALRDVD